MTTLGKTIFITLGLAVLVAGTLALRCGPDEQAARTRLSPSQVAEMQQAAKPVEPAKPAVTATHDEPPMPDWDDPEDGSGS
jgi:hypothetical protein